MSDVTSLSRRTVLRGAATATVALPLGALALSACSRGPSPEQTLADRLVPLASAAVASAAAARLLATTEPKQATALGQIATIRDEHAKLLREEILRLHPSSGHAIVDPSASATPSAAPGSSAPPPSPAAPAAAGLDAFKSSLSADAAAAQQVAIGTSGFQAGLTASVSAAVTSLKGLLP